MKYFAVIFFIEQPGFNNKIHCQYSKHLHRGLYILVLGGTIMTKIIAIHFRFIYLMFYALPFMLFQSSENVT